MNHHFNSEIAVKFGINVAIFLDQMAFWITKNRANNKHFYDGAFWTRNTAEAYTLIFPYWSSKQIRKIIADCEAFGLINIGNYNKVKYDRTQWYSLTEYAAKLLNIPILPNGKMEVTKKGNGSYKKVTPIPVADTVTNTFKAAPALFEPDKQNIAFASKHGIPIEKALDTFKKKYEGEKTQAAFCNWLKLEKEFSTKKILNEPVSAVNKQEFHVADPEWSKKYTESLNNRRIISHGSEIARNNIRGTSVRQAKDYLFS